MSTTKLLSECCEASRRLVIALRQQSVGSSRTREVHKLALLSVPEGMEEESRMEPSFISFFYDSRSLFTVGAITSIQTLISFDTRSGKNGFFLSSTSQRTFWILTPSLHHLFIASAEKILLSLNMLDEQRTIALLPRGAANDERGGDKKALNIWKSIPRLRRWVGLTLGEIDKLRFYVWMRRSGVRSSASFFRSRLEMLMWDSGAWGWQDAEKLIF